MKRFVVTPNKLELELEPGQTSPSLVFQACDEEGASLDVEVEASDEWLDVTMLKERGGFALVVRPEAEGEPLRLGKHPGNLFVTDPDTFGSVRVPVTLVVTAAASTASEEELAVNVEQVFEASPVVVAPPVTAKPTKPKRQRKQAKGSPDLPKALDDELWVRNVFHERENLYVGKVLEMLVPAGLRLRIDALRASNALPRLDPRYLQDPATSSIALARVFGWGARALGIACPPLYIRGDLAGGLIAVASDPPACVAGGLLLQGFSAADLAFVVGRHLADYRGEHYLRTLFPTLAELRVLFYAGLQLGDPGFTPPPALSAQVEASRDLLAPLVEPSRRQALRLLSARLRASGSVPDVDVWCRSVDITAARAGFLLCGDVAIARRMLAWEGPRPSGLLPEAVATELETYARSKAYAALREALGGA